MLDALKKWFQRGSKGQGPAEAVSQWARQRELVFRPVRDGEGFVIEGKVGTALWRLEWGPSQRPYVQGAELRVRAELGLPVDLQALVLSRELKDAMEKEVFDQFVEDVQTRIDTSTPPEMRWLVMLPKLSGAELKGLRERYAAVCSAKPWLMAWLEGPLGQELMSAPRAAGQPVVLMVGRGRLTLRTALPEPDHVRLEAWLKVFETAIRESNRLSVAMGDSQVPSTQPSLWSRPDGGPNPG
jgi:hypothetical protein